MKISNKVQFLHVIETKKGKFISVFTKLRNIIDVDFAAKNLCSSIAWDVCTSPITGYILFILFFIYYH